MSDDRHAHIDPNGMIQYDDDGFGYKDDLNRPLPPPGPKQPNLWPVILVTVIGLCLVLSILAVAIANWPHPSATPTPTHVVSYPTQRPTTAYKPPTPTRFVPPKVPSVTAVPQTGIWYPCDNMQASYLHPGMTVKVSDLPDLPNRLRSSPRYDNNSDSNYVGSAPVGTKMKILDGPYCDTQSSIIYWRVKIISKDMILNFSGNSSELNSVYTGESDGSGYEWLIPSN